MLCHLTDELFRVTNECPFEHVVGPERQQLAEWFTVRNAPSALLAQVNQFIVDRAACRNHLKDCGTGVTRPVIEGREAF